MNRALTCEAALPLITLPLLLLLLLLLLLIAPGYISVFAKQTCATIGSPLNLDCAFHASDPGSRGGGSLLAVDFTSLSVHYRLAQESAAGLVRILKTLSARKPSHKLNNDI